MPLNRHDLIQGTLNDGINTSPNGTNGVQVAVGSAAFILDTDNIFIYRLSYLIAPVQYIIWLFQWYL